MIDDSFKELFEFFKVLATIFAGVATPIIAFEGLSTWRKQLKGKTEYELARRLLLATYKVREAIRVVRNPLIIFGEILDAMKEAEEEIPKDSFKVMDKGAKYVYKKRWDEVQNALITFDAETLEAEVVWGKDIKKTTKHLRGDLIPKLRVSVEDYVNRKEKELDKEYIKELITIVYGLGGDDLEKDEFGKKIQEAIEEIEDFLKPHLKEIENLGD